MYLVRSDRKILSMLIKAQSSEARYVFIDASGSRVYHVEGYYSDDTKRALQSDKYIPIEYDSAVINGSIEFLLKHDLIRKMHGGSVYQVTCEGWRNSSVQWHDFFHAVVTHFAFPSLVALVTTLLTLLIAA